METEVKVPAGPRGAGPAAVGAPVKEKIREMLEETMASLVNWCQGPIDTGTPATSVAAAVVDLFKKYIESRRERLRDVVDLIVEEVYMSGNMALNVDHFVDRIIQAILEGL